MSYFVRNTNFNLLWGSLPRLGWVVKGSLIQFWFRERILNGLNRNVVFVRNTSFQLLWGSLPRLGWVVQVSLIQFKVEVRRY